MLPALLWGALTSSASRLHPLETAHASAGRTTFTVCAPSDGVFAAALLLGLSADAGGEPGALRVNGRPSPHNRSQLLTLRRGLNTVSYRSRDVSAGGLRVSGAVPCSGPAAAPLFRTLEAEYARCTGSVIGPTFEGYTDVAHLPTEASGRRACQLKTPA